MNNPLREGDLCIITGCHRPELESNIGRVVTLLKFCQANEYTNFDDLVGRPIDDGWFIKGQNLKLFYCDGSISYHHVGLCHSIHLKKINEDPDIPGSSTFLAGDKDKGVLVKVIPDSYVFPTGNADRELVHIHTL